MDWNLVDGDTGSQDSQRASDMSIAGSSDPPSIISKDSNGNRVDEATHQSTFSNASGVSAGNERPSSSKRNRQHKNSTRRMTKKAKRVVPLEIPMVLEEVLINRDTKVRRYDVALAASFDQEGKKTHCAQIIELATHDSGELKFDKWSLEEAGMFLEKAANGEKTEDGKNIPGEKIALSLRIIWQEVNTKYICKFLYDVGEHVERLFVRGCVSAQVFSKVLSLIPNLIRLDFVSFALIGDFSEVDEDTQMEFLKTIDCGEGGTKLLEHIFVISPNLEEIHRFPVLSVNVGALIDTVKACCVKSIRYPKPIQYEFRTALETLSNLNIKLTDFSFHRLKIQFYDRQQQRSVRRILKSSRDTLERLTLWKTESFPFQALPPMNFLKEIVFQLQPQNQDGGKKLFAPHTDLRRVFPNVSVVSVRKPKTVPLNMYYYEDQFASWGPQIKHLKLVHVSGDTLQQMSTAFPCLQHLEFNPSDSSELMDALRGIGEYWPAMEHVTVEIGFLILSGTSLESSLTGLPELQTLTFILRDSGRDSEEHLGKPPSTKYASKEFGFQLLPHLKIIVLGLVDQLSKFQMQ